MARIVLLAPSYPFPPRGGIQLRVHSFIERLTPRYGVDLLCFDDEPERPAPPAGVRVTRAPYPQVRGTGGWRQFLNPTPTLVRRFRSVEMERRLRERDWSDVVALHAETLQLGQYLPLAPAGVPRLLFNDNVESRILERLAATRRGLKRLYWSREAGKLASAEGRLMRLADLVVAVSEVDAAEFRRLLPAEKVRVAPLLLDLSAFRAVASEPPAQPPRLTFVGSFDWHVNEAAALWLVNEVWPLIREPCPEAELYLVGRNPTAAVRALGEAPRVVVTGTVEDVAAYVGASAAMLVPLRYGSGMRSKILEAWAARRPVVSTTVGCEGLPAKDGENLWVADEAAAFAEACVAVLQVPERSRALVECGAATGEAFERQAEDAFRAAYAAVGLPL